MARMLTPSWWREAWVCLFAVILSSCFITSSTVSMARRRNAGAVQVCRLRFRRCIPPDGIGVTCTNSACNNTRHTFLLYHLLQHRGHAAATQEPSARVAPLPGRSIQGDTAMWHLCVSG